MQNPVRLNDYSEPEPDIVLLKHRADHYEGKRVSAEDVLLMVEVSDTTIRYDRDFKLQRYAAAGIPEVWIEDLENNQLLAYRNPHGGAYAMAAALRSGDSISPLAFPETTFSVADLLG